MMPHRYTRKNDVCTIAAGHSRTGLGLLAGALAIAMLLAQPAAAGSHGDAHGDHGESHQGDQSEESTAVQAYREANDRMHEDMMVGYSGDADVDFVRGMIPHHQGAIDMANIVLEHGKDEEVRRLAEDVIANQGEEIAFLRDWLEAHGHAVD